MITNTIPSQCMLCANLNKCTNNCNVYDAFPGEVGREDVKECPAYYDGSRNEELKMLAQYIDEDPDRLVEKQIEDVVSRIIAGYEEKFKIMVVGIARRKIRTMIKMVDVIDILIDKLTDRETIQDMSHNQTLRLLSELNYSVNNDLTFVMKLVNPDTKLHDLQMWVDARSVINVNGASQTTEMKSEEILNLTNVSRDKIREAFDALVNNIPMDDELSEEHVLSEEDKEELDNL